MLKKLKDGATEAATNATIEANYLQGKKSGYHHPPEVEAQIEIMRENREEIPNLREDVTTKLNLEKDVAAAEAKSAADFTNMAQHPSLHPELKEIMINYAALMTAMSSNRFNYHATVEQIKEQWKTLETNELKDIRTKQDQANRAWITKKYWDKEKKPGKIAECDAQYKIFVSELVHLIHELREKKEELLPGYLLGIVQSEMELYRKCLDELVKCETTLRSMGHVTPVKFTDYDKFAPTSSGFHDPEGGGPPTTVDPSPRPPPISARGGAGAGASALPKAKGLFPFQAQSPDELSFQPNDILGIVSQSGDWWTAELNGKRGLIPSNYVQLL